jgi:ribosomal protein L33
LLVAIRRVIIVKLVSTALTGVFYPASKPRTAPKMAMMKYDKVGKYSLALLYLGSATRARASSLWNVETFGSLSSVRPI